jgi:phosphatidylcholine synthase
MTGNAGNVRILARVAAWRAGRGEEKAMTTQNKPVPAQRAAGYSVHVFTASGGAVALLALYAAIERNFPSCFAWLGLALFIDGVDGTLARAARVTVTAAYIDGVVLDLVVDFLTYVLVPVVALWRSDLMPTQVSFWIGLVVTIASALYFADTRMKTQDLWFRGFPALWNVFVLYLFVMKLPWLVNAALLLMATALMFAPIVFVHPMRVKTWRAATILASIAWFALAGVAIYDDLSPPAWNVAGLVLLAGYFIGLPLLRHSPWAHR